MTPLSAYLHVPFCTHRCGYCNFTLVSGRPDLVVPFLDAIERELSLLGTPRPVRTLFFWRWDADLLEHRGFGKVSGDCTVLAPVGAGRGMVR